MSSDLVSGSERRTGMRVPVRGVAVFYGEDGATHGTIENLSSGGALVSVRGVPATGDGLDLELKLGSETGWVSARAVRVERDVARTRIAVVFERVDEHVRAAIDAAIAHALRAAQRRPILIVEPVRARRIAIATRLAARGMTPLVPRTPLEAIDLLARTQVHVGVCLVAPSSELYAALAESFPWVPIAELTEDLDASVERAIHAWARSDGARVARALA